MKKVRKTTIMALRLKYCAAVLLITAFLTWFFYAHEKLPKPLRAATAIIETPVALSSGISHYFGLGIPVYESLTAIIISNLIASAIIVTLVFLFKTRRKSKK